MSVTVQVLG